MRILILSHNYFPEPTGIPFYNTDAARHWAQCGNSVTVCTGIPHYPWWEVPENYARKSYLWGRGDENDGKVLVKRVRHFVPARPASGLHRMLMDAHYLLLWSVRLMVHNRRPNVIIAVAPPFLIGFLAIMAKIRFGQRIPIIYHVQDLQVDAAIDLRMLPRWLTKPLLLLERLQLRLVDQVTTVSNGMLQRLRSKGPTKRSIKLWKNWADCSAIQPQADGATAEYRNLLNLLDNDCLVLYSGNLGKKQGLDDLLDAIDRLRECEKLHWVIAGQGAERQHLEEKAKELNLPRLTFMDLQPLEKLPAFLCAADIHVIPQKAVAADLVMPSKLLNILAVARPVIACAAPGTELHTVISEAQCGKTCAPEDPKALADAIQSYYLATDERLLAGTMGRVYVEEELDKPKVLGKAMELFQSLITETRR